MFHQEVAPPSRTSPWAIAGLALLSLVALILTAWILIDFSREQEILKELMQHLPPGNLLKANELEGELRLQWRLSVLLILNIAATVVAITLLVRAYISSERRLREVQVLATDILGSLDQGIITTDRKGRIFSINPQGRELLGLAENGTGIALSDLSPQHATLQEICQQVLDGHARVRDRDYMASQNGHLRHLRAGCSLLQDHAQRQLGTVVHIRDVTEKSLMEQRLRRMERYMGLGAMAAGLQHEIKNPLSALSLHVQLLSEALQKESLQPAIQEMLEVLHTETRRIAGVLEGFRDFASVAELHRSPVDLGVLIEKLVRLIEPQAKQNRIRVVVERSDGQLPCLRLDRSRIEQVLLNLALNAMEAMPEGGTLTIRLRDVADAVEIDVADTGRGIPQDLRDKVFDPYFTTRPTGTGMGLALSEKFVRQHNGTIEFQTGVAGTVFTIALPKDQDP